MIMYHINMVNIWKMFKNEAVHLELLVTRMPTIIIVGRFFQAVPSV